MKSITTITLAALLMLAPPLLRAQPAPPPGASADINGSLYAPVHAAGPTTAVLQGGGSLPYSLAASSLQQTLRLGLEGGGSIAAGTIEHLTGVTRFTTDTLPVGGSAAPGSAATFNVALRFDGHASTHAVGGNASSAWSSETTTTLTYQVYDLDSDIWHSDDQPVFDFQLVTQTTYAASGLDPNDPISSNVGRASAQASFADGTYWFWAGAFEDVTNHPTVYGPTTTMLLDTGILNFAIDTAIGHRLFVVAQIETTLLGYGGVGGATWTALAAFDKTFDAEWSALTPGALLEGVQAGVFTAPVPEPQAWALMALGLGLVGWRRWRGAAR